MSIGNGRLCAALGGLILALLAGAAHCQPAQDPEKGKATQAQQPGGKGDVPPPVNPTKPSPNRPQATSQSCGKPEAAIKDTDCAQIRSAEAAEAQVRAARDQVVLGWWQFGGLFASLCIAVLATIAAINAARWAKTAAMHSARGVKAATDQLEAVKVAEQAYVVFEADQREGGSGAIKLMATNTGRTPGYVESVRYMTRKTLPAKATLEGLQLARRECDYDLPTDFKMHPICTIPAPLPVSRPHLVGYVEYLDVYRRYHYQHFRFDRVGNGGWRVAGGKKWNRRRNPKPS